MYTYMFSCPWHYLVVSSQLHDPADLPLGWVGPRTGLEDMEKRQFLTLPGLELRCLGRPGCSQSLYRLSYPGSQFYRAT
jgi:hypothetical protein